MKATTHPRRTAILFAAVVPLFATQIHAQNFTYTGANNGTWHINSNWSGGVYPNSTTANAFILSGANVVLGNVGSQVATLTLNPGNSLLINPASTGLSVWGSSVANFGTITIAIPGQLPVSFLNLSQGTITTLSGHGTIAMNQAGYLLGSTLGFINQDNYIRGEGNIGDNNSFIDNRAGGVLNADLAGKTLKLDTSEALTSLNKGIMRATNGGILAMGSGTLNSFIDATHNAYLDAQTGSCVSLTATADLLNTNLISSGTGTIAVAVNATPTLHNCTNFGDMQLMTSTVLSIQGAFNNSGSINFSAGFGTLAFLDAPSATLTGGGTITLNSGSSYITTPGFGLVNVNNTIRGDGILCPNTGSITLQNGAQIIADHAGKVLRMPDAPCVNQGYMGATNGGILQLGQGTLNCGIGGGTLIAIIEAQNASVVSMPFNSTVVSAALHSAGNGTFAIRSGAAPVFDGCQNSGNVQVDPGGNLHLRGLVTNYGSITVNAGGKLTFDGDVVFNGLNPGTVILGSSGSPATSVGGTGVVQFLGTIRGACSNVGTTGFGMRINGTLIADNAASPLVLFPDATLLHWENQGTFMASGGRLVLNGQLGGVLLNNGYVIANGTDVQMNGMQITNGTFTSTGAGAVHVTAQTNSLTGVTNTGILIVDAGATLSLGGTCVNNGTITNNGTLSNGGTLNNNGTINNALLMTNTGTIVMGGAALIGGTGTFTSSGLISGAGSLGMNTLRMSSSGTVNASNATLTMNVDPSTAAGFVNTGTLLASTGVMNLTGNGGGSFVSSAGTIITNATGTMRVISAGSLTANDITNNGTFNVDASAVTARSIRGTGSLNLTANGSFAFNAGGGTLGTSKVASITATAGKLNLTDHDLIVDYTGATSIAAVGTLIATGYNGGAWTGATGITSSTAATASTSATKTALGYCEASFRFATFPATFSGQSIDNTAVLLLYTLSGDANCDKTVTSGDFNILASNFGGSGKRWYQADFNYNGTVDSTDFNLLAGNFGKTLPSSPGASVPEPAICGLALIGTLLLRRRRAQ